MSSIMKQFREWRRNVPAEWKRPEDTSQIHPRFFESALRTAFKLGAKERKGIEGLAEDVKRYVDFVDEPKYAPPAQFRRATMHRQQITDAWIAMEAAADAADLPGFVTACVSMIMNIGHAWAEFGVPYALVWQIATNAYKAKKLMGAGGECEYEADGRIKWPAGVLAMFKDEVDTAIDNPVSE